MSDRLIQIYTIQQGCNCNNYIGVAVLVVTGEREGGRRLNTLNYLVVQLSSVTARSPDPGPAGRTSLQLWAWSSRCSGCLLFRPRSILAFKSLLHCSWLNGYNVSTENKEDTARVVLLSIVFQIDNIKLI